MKVRYSYLKEKFGDRELRQRIYADFDRLLDRGDFTLGSAVAEFERRFAELVGARFAIGVANGTDAIRLALQAVGVGHGDEVITGANSFIASAGAIAELGAVSVFVDMADWFTLDADLIESAISERTRAILPVHFTGEPAEMDKVLEIAAKYRLPVVEDCAQAVLAEYRGVRCGNFGRAGCFSLHPLKNLNVWGDGGMICTNDAGLDRHLRLARNHGMRNRDEIVFLGCNSRLDSLQAIVGNNLIGKTPADVEQRRLNAAYFDTRLEAIPGVRIPTRRPHVESCFHLYMFYVEQSVEVRNGLVAHLNTAGIEAKVHYPIPMYRQEAFRNANVLNAEVFPVADAQADSIVTLPVDEHLTKAQQDYCIEVIRGYFSN